MILLRIMTLHSNHKEYCNAKLENLLYWWYKIKYLKSKQVQELNSYWVDLYKHFKAIKESPSVSAWKSFQGVKNPTWTLTSSTDLLVQSIIAFNNGIQEVHYSYLTIIIGFHGPTLAKYFVPVRLNVWLEKSYIKFILPLWKKLYKWYIFICTCSSNIELLVAHMKSILPQFKVFYFSTVQYCGDRIPYMYRLSK